MRTTRWSAPAAVSLILCLNAAGQGRPTGLVPATPEQLRGIPLASTPFSGAELPASVDLSPWMPPPQHQGELNSCTAWSVAYAVKSYQEYVEEKKPLIRSDGAIDPDRVFSPAFVYNQLNNGRNAGIPFIYALNLLREQGAAPWSLMPYDGKDLARQPGPEARSAARRYRIDYWRQVNVHDPRELKAHLHAGYPVIFGAKMDPSFEKAAGGFVWKRTKEGRCEGGECGYHAMVLVGYDDAKNAFKLINSWGTQWGDGGYGWIDYDHFGRVSTEAYVAKDALNGPAQEEPTIPDPPRALEFRLTAVNPSAVMPDRPQDGYYLRFDGTLTIPRGMGSANQIAVSFWYDAGNGTKGAMVPAVAPAYATVYGQAACGTARYPVPAEGLTTTWAAWIPYAALNVPAGSYVNSPAGPVYQPRSTALLAEAVLYVDNFGVATAPAVPFLVSR